MNSVSLLQKKRMEYKPLFPKILKNLSGVAFQSLETIFPSVDLKQHFPNTFGLSTYQLASGTGDNRRLRVGVVFSGGQAAGGHNVITALYDAGATVIGFLDGPSGIVENKWVLIESVDAYRNQGGFDLLGSGRTKIETEEQLLGAMKAVQLNELDGLLIIGGDDSNTNAAVLAEYFLQKGCKTKVVGVPKTIDGDLRSKDIELSFGFDSACKTYAEIIGNIQRDALSAKKYYHVIKLMGRTASHIALECALMTRPNLALIGEERRDLSEIVSDIADLIIERFEAKKEYGVILLPEGLIEFVNELSSWAKDLNLEKDPHGNIQVSKIQTEKFLIELVLKELQRRGFKGKLNIQDHFLGYEGRSCMPTNFDANYCYTLGLSAYLAIRDGLTGVIIAVQNLKKAPSEWIVKAVPIVQLIHFEMRLGKKKPVIKKALVELSSGSYLSFAEQRQKWRVEDHYRYPGPIQFFGEPELTDSHPLTL